MALLLLHRNSTRSPGKRNDIREFFICSDPAYRYAHAGYSLVGVEPETSKIGVALIASARHYVGAEMKAIGR